MHRSASERTCPATVWSARVVVSERGRGDVPDPPLLGRIVAPTQRLTVGRRAEVALGVQVSDPGISRVALRLQLASDGWSVAVTNRGGALVCPWGLARTWVPDGQSVVWAWPRVAIRVMSTVRDDQEHWVLLESDASTLPRFPPNGRPPRDADDTSTTRPPPPLTPAMSEAVALVFAQHLEWPPRAAPQSATLDTVARKLSISTTAVQERLRGAQARARSLGLHWDHPCTDVDYVHHLVAHGYLAAVPPPVDCPRTTG